MVPLLRATRIGVMVIPFLGSEREGGLTGSRIAMVFVGIAILAIGLIGMTGPTPSRAGSALFMIIGIACIYQASIWL